MNMAFRAFMHIQILYSCLFFEMVRAYHISISPTVQVVEGSMHVRNNNAYKITV